MLAQNKIFANEKLMLIHLISFFTLTIIMITEEALILTGEFKDEINIDNVSEK